MLCLVQLSKWRECKAKDAEKLLSQWEKVAKCNFKSNAQVYERCFFHEMKCYLQCRRQIFMFRAFLRAKNTNAVRAKNTNACLVQLSKWRECKAKDAEKLLSQWEKGAKFNFKIKAQVYERCFFFMKWNVICNAEDRFSCVRAFLQSKSC